MKKKGKDRREVIKKVKKGRKKNGGRVRVAGKVGGQEKRKGEGEGMGQHIKSRAKSLNPLGGKAELREGKDSPTLATFHVKRRQNVKNTGAFLLLQNFNYFKIMLHRFSCKHLALMKIRTKPFFWLLFLRGILKCCIKAQNQMR